MTVFGLRVKLRRFKSEAKKPSKGTSGSAYYDLYAAEASHLNTLETKALSTGFEIEVPAGWFLDIRTRSGMACKGIIVANAPGTVDADFRGELKVILTNLSMQSYEVKVGDRVAQCALMPVHGCEFVLRSRLSQTERGKGGYGSTGR